MLADIPLQVFSLADVKSSFFLSAYILVFYKTQKQHENSKRRSDNNGKVFENVS